LRGMPPSNVPNWGGPRGTPGPMQSSPDYGRIQQHRVY